MSRQRRADNPRHFLRLMMQKFSCTMVKGYGIGWAVLLLLSGTYVQLAAQNCTECTAAMEPALQAFAERLDVPLNRIVVDTTESGRRSYPSAPRVAPPLPLSAGDIFASAQRLGFRTASESQFHACFHPGPRTVPVPSYCNGASESVGVVLFAPEILGDLASIYLRYYVDHPERTTVAAGTMRVDLSRDGQRQWQVTGLSMLARGHRPR